MHTPSVQFGRYSQTTLERRQSLPFWPQVDQYLKGNMPNDMHRIDFIRHCVKDLHKALQTDPKDTVTLNMITDTLKDKDPQSIFNQTAYLGAFEATLQHPNFPEVPEFIAQAIEDAFRRAADRGDLS